MRVFLHQKVTTFQRYHVQTETRRNAGHVRRTAFLHMCRRVQWTDRIANPVRNALCDGDTNALCDGDTNALCDGEHFRLHRTLLLQTRLSVLRSTGEHA